MRDPVREETDLNPYYDFRAPIYEEIYHREDPGQQEELEKIASFVKERLCGRRILEIACGTGYWSEKASESALHLTGIDSSVEMLGLARRKRWPPGKVKFLEADAYELDGVAGDFDAVLANFWLSHVPKSRMEKFLDDLHRRIGTGGLVVMADNVLVEGLGGRLCKPEGSNDTYKIRELPDGSEHFVLKNYYSYEQLQGIMDPWADKLEIHKGSFYWWLSYNVLRA
jgi:ubiquinone/menaquinone biosynthesis C-methylase UbiE